MGFHMQEVETAVRYGLPIVFLVCADQQWGMVKMTQIVGLGMAARAVPQGPLERAGDQRRHRPPSRGTSSAEPWARTASGCPTPTSWNPRYAAPLDSGKCAVIHVDVDPGKHLFAPGLMHFKDMHQEPAG